MTWWWISVEQICTLSVLWLQRLKIKFHILTLILWAQMDWPGSAGHFFWGWGLIVTAAKNVVSRKGKMQLTAGEDSRGEGSWYLSTESFFTIRQGLFLMAEIIFFLCSTCSISIASSSSDSDSSSNELEDSEEVLEDMKLTAQNWKIHHS